MARGRRPLPTATKKLKGTYRKNRDKGEPNLPKDFPAAPSNLTADQEEVWKQMAELIDPMKVTTKSDQMTLALLIRTIDRWNKANKAIEEAGQCYENVNRAGANIIRLHPAVGIVERSEKFILKTLIEFGLTPAARSRVTDRTSLESGGTTEQKEKAGVTDIDSFQKRRKRVAR